MVRDSIRALLNLAGGGLLLGLTSCQTPNPPPPPPPVEAAPVAEPSEPPPVVESSEVGPTQTGSPEYTPLGPTVPTPGSFRMRGGRRTDVFPLDRDGQISLGVKEGIAVRQVYREDLDNGSIKIWLRLENIDEHHLWLEVECRTPHLVEDALQERTEMPRGAWRDFIFVLRPIPDKTTLLIKTRHHPW